MRSLISRSTLWFAYIACGCLLLLMMVTFVDVIGRYMFNRPVTFAVELIELLMGMVVFFGLAYTTLKKAHITVDLILDAVSGIFKATLLKLAALISATVIILMAWQLTKRGIGFLQSGLSTDVLYMRVAPFVFIMCAGVFLAALVAVVQLFRPDYLSSVEPQNDKALEEH
ncbi:MAG: TRAP transporter small permease [Granulosicoccus sp.]